MGGKRVGAGRKRTADAAKVLRGTFRVDRSTPNAPPPAPDPPKPPTWLPAAAAKIFRVLVRRLEAERRASASHTEVLALAALRLSEVETYTRALKRGHTYASKGGLIRVRPEVTLRNEAQRHAHTLLAELGLTPSARGGLAARPAKRGNPFGGIEAG